MPPQNAKSLLNTSAGLNIQLIALQTSTIDSVSGRKPNRGAQIEISSLVEAVKTIDQ